MGWTSADNLVVVLEDGTMAVYNVHGQRQYTRVITRVSSNVPGGRGGGYHAEHV